mmetsp:Transcript_18096/g.46313  ORF Transcript_18096/g.46313 Transcript_18096/m.46313 type:complete len:200 (+) Transcript_18096:154-753(+)
MDRSRIMHCNICDASVEVTGETRVYFALCAWPAELLTFVRACQGPSNDSWCKRSTTNHFRGRRATRCRIVTIVLAAATWQRHSIAYVATEMLVAGALRRRTNSSSLFDTVRVIRKLRQSNTVARITEECLSCFYRCRQLTPLGTLLIKLCLEGGVTRLNGFQLSARDAVGQLQCKPNKLVLKLFLALQLTSMLFAQNLR